MIKTLKKMRFIPLLLALLLIAMMAAPTTSMAAGQPTVDLRSTKSFAVLSGKTITNTGATTISGKLPEGGGNVGLYPGSAFTHQADVTMTGWKAYLSDKAGVALRAKNDLIKVYDDAAGRTPFKTIGSELGGQTLKPGIYRSNSGFLITGTLTLDGNGDPNPVFVFQAGSTLITASHSKIILKNGALYCRIFWQVGSSATLGTYSQFVGHIFALTSIAAKTGATVQGQLLARNGSVTLDHNTIINGLCVVTPALTPTVGSGASSGGSGIPPTGDNSMGTIIFLFASVTISAFIAFVIRKVTNKHN